MSDLTFQPSRDDPAALKAFLKTVHQRYEAEKRVDELIDAADVYSRAGSSVSSSKSAKAAVLPSSSRVQVLDGEGRLNVGNQGEAGVNLQDPLNYQREMMPPPPQPPTKPTAAMQAVLKQALTASKVGTSASASVKKRPADSGRSTAASGSKKRKKRTTKVELSTATKCSLMKAKQIDTRAPDPELVGPPNETEDQRRRRMERINGRRKRTKKLIEIDQLNEQVVDLSKRNKHLNRQNKDLRKARDALKLARSFGGDGTNLEDAVTEALLVVGESAEPDEEKSAEDNQGMARQEDGLKASPQQKAATPKYQPAMPSSPPLTDHQQHLSVLPPPAQQQFTTSPRGQHVSYQDMLRSYHQHAPTMMQQHHHQEQKADDVLFRPPTLLGGPTGHTGGLAMASTWNNSLQMQLVLASNAPLAAPAAMGQHGHMGTGGGMGPLLRQRQQQQQQQQQLQQQQQQQNIAANASLQDRIRALHTQNLEDQIRALNSQPRPPGGDANYPRRFYDHRG